MKPPESYECHGNGELTRQNIGGGGSKSANPLVRLIQNHYSTPDASITQKSKESIERDRWLIPGLVPFNRWALMPAAIAIQFCCGSLYAWSVFNKPIDQLIFGVNRNLAPITFYITVGCFGSAAAVMGPWLERHGPLPTCVIGACLLAAGNFITALALVVKQIWLVYLGNGVVAGLGIGLCYISPVSALQKWFPDKRGLASGFAVSGFGAGAIVISKVQSPLKAALGLPATFVILGAIYFIFTTCSALVLRTPPPKHTVATAEDDPKAPAPMVIDEPPPMTLLESLASRSYRLMYITFFANVIFGLVVISRLSNMITDIFARSPEEAATIVSINGGFNLGGRLLMSVLSDFVGRKNCFVGMLTAQLVILGTFSAITTTGTYWAFLLTMWTLTACYGAGFGVIPAFLTDKFGPVNIGACHGIILTALSLAGVAGGLIFTAVFDKLKEGREGSDPHPYNVNAWWMFGVVFVGWTATLFIEPTANDRRFVGKVKGVLCCCGRGLLHQASPASSNLTKNVTISP